MNALDSVTTSAATRIAGSAPDKHYRAVIFDWDGTLLDSTYHIVEALLGACRDLDLREPSREEAGWVIGLSLQAALYRLVPDLGADRVDAFVERYRVHFMALQHEMRLFEGQAGLLHDLSAGGVVLGVATGKSRRGLDASIEQLGLRDLFRATRTADEARGKPDPDMLLQLLAELDLVPDTVLMVGDTTHDVLMAQAAGVDSLAVGYGAHAPSLLESARPTALVGTVPDMQAWIRARTG
ncbi:MAG: HAD-IA family hydrolase [Castellaniella sp.]|uniref:HAD-IA family hydrolase n=1 Tax=Castellaniella sp. TaxID=1955812 RepID=UPI002A35A65D|nr:HAD-IA family hydrolase [Castellaniella sp.]MDY0309116.1 HAD-IA family hydrolase [Castellaniella sp.]